MRRPSLRVIRPVGIRNSIHMFGLPGSFRRNVHMGRTGLWFSYGRPALDHTAPRHGFLGRRASSRSICLVHMPELRGGVHGLRVRLPLLRGIPRMHLLHRLRDRDRRLTRIGIGPVQVVLRPSGPAGI